MRKDENGNECPSTLGEYRKMCAALWGDEGGAVKFLDRKIAKQGENEEVIAGDRTMRTLLFLLNDSKKSPR